MLAEAGRDRRRRPGARRAAGGSRTSRARARRSTHVLLDDAHELDPAARALVHELRRTRADRRRRPGAARDPAAEARARRSPLESQRAVSRAGAARRVRRGRRAVAPDAAAGGEVAFWRCANDRAQAQAVAADIERLIAREGVDPGAVVGARADGLARGAGGRGRARGASRAPPASSARRRSSSAPRSGTCWRGCGCWPIRPTPRRSVRALARPPIELRSVDIARCTQIARRRKLDMVAALAAATESPQVPPEARERIRVFLKLYRVGRRGTRHHAPRPVRPPPDRPARAAPPPAVRRPGRRRRAAAGARAVRRARLGLRAPRARRRTPREFARSIAAVADSGLREHDEPELVGRARASRWWRSTPPARSRPSTCTSSGCTPGWRRPHPSGFPGARCRLAIGRSQQDAARGARGARCTGRSRRARAAGGRARVPERQRPRRGAAPGAGARGGQRGARGRRGRTARRSCSARPRRSTRPTGCCATSCSRGRCAPAGGSASCGSTPTSTSRTRSCATSSC